MRNRLLVSTAIGVASGIFCRYLMVHFGLGAGDFGWAIQAARSLLSHRNPYANPQQLYPLTASFFALPFLWLPPAAAAGAFYGISSALLAFGLTKNGYRRLLIFLAYPYWAGILTAQWAPLIMAGALSPVLLPTVVAKPQLGFPVILTNRNRIGILICFIVVLVSFAIMPTWPLLWISNAAHYRRFVPLLIFPGPLLALAMIRYRDPDSHLLLLMAVMPQRWFYDTFILWLIPKSRRQIAWTVFLSWGPAIWRWYHTPESAAQVGRWAVIFIYLPMLCVILLRPRGAGAGLALQHGKGASLRLPATDHLDPEN